METENITLTVRKDILRKAELLATRRNITLSRLVTEALEELLAREEEYEAARRWHLKLLERGFDLGSGGTATWRREDLHRSQSPPRAKARR
jgi:hypothetical protein